MQTTLLGLAIAIILALVSALVAPLVVDWNHYRAAVEAEASRLTGLSVRVNGTIDARILPSPVITLRNVEVGAAGQRAATARRHARARTRARPAAARRGAGFRGAPHRAADQPRARPLRRHRLAGAVAVVPAGGALHLASQRRGRARHSHRRSVRLAAGAAQALVQRRHPLVRRTVQAAKAPSSSATSFTAIGYRAVAREGGGGAQDQARRRSVRSSADDRDRRHAEPSIAASRNSRARWRWRGRSAPRWRAASG